MTAMHISRPRKALYGGRSLSPQEIRACRATLRALAERLPMEALAHATRRTATTLQQYLKGTTQPSRNAWEQIQKAAQAHDVPVIEPEAPKPLPTRDSGFDWHAAKRALGGLA